MSGAPLPAGPPVTRRSSHPIVTPLRQYRDVSQCPFQVTWRWMMITFAGRLPLFTEPYNTQHITGVYIAYPSSKLTLWRPLLPYGYSYKASLQPDRVKLSFPDADSDAQPWASECRDVKNYKWQLNLGNSGRRRIKLYGTRAYTLLQYQISLLYLNNKHFSSHCDSQKLGGVGACYSE